MSDCVYFLGQAAPLLVVALMIVWEAKAWCRPLCLREGKGVTRTLKDLKLLEQAQRIQELEVAISAFLTDLDAGKIADDQPLRDALKQFDPETGDTFNIRLKGER
jgi:hypothetical protein